MGDMAKIELKDRPILSQNIVLLRKSLGWTQPDLAEKTGYHVNIIKRIEAGKGEGEPATREAIAQALGVALSDLYRVARPRDFKLEDRAKYPDLNPLSRRPIPIDPARILELFQVNDPTRQAAVMALLTGDPLFLNELTKAGVEKNLVLALRRFLDTNGFGPPK